MNVAVIGAGVMGEGVAQDLASHAVDVVLVDVAEGKLDRAMRNVKNALRMQTLLGGEAVDVDSVLGRITPTLSLDAAAGADFVIENVTEDIAVKRPVYLALDAACGRDAVFIVNTSAIPIAEIGALTERPDRVVGVHFMNPVPQKRAVELIASPHTSADTVARTKALLASLKKQAIPVNDAPGFVSNRVLMLMINEAIGVLHRGTATAANIDRVFTECMHHKMGPLATADLIGLDTILRTLEVLFARLHEDRFKPSPLLVTHVEHGKLGRKSGQGFFRYPIVEGV